MSSTDHQRKWIEYGKELEAIIRENNLKSKPEKKSLSQIFREFAENKDTTAHSASYYYYEEIKPRIQAEENQAKENAENIGKKEAKKEEIKPLVNIDESIDNFTRSTTTDLRDPRDIYKIGDVLEVEIVSIQDFGVFTKTKEGFEGLIHISEITGKEFVEMPEDYFYVGEKVKAKLKRFDNDKKLNLSTRQLGGKEKINPIFKEIAISNIVDDESESTKTELSQTKNKKRIIDKEVKTIKKEHEQDNVSSSTTENKSQKQKSERDEIIEYIKKYSDNNVSQSALADIDEMIEQYGVFKTTISLIEVLRDLDISSFITRETKEKISGGCLRRNF